MFCNSRHPRSDQPISRVSFNRLEMAPGQKGRSSPSYPLELYGRCGKSIPVGQVTMVTGYGEELSTRRNGHSRPLVGWAGGWIQDDGEDFGGVQGGEESGKWVDGPCESEMDSVQDFCVPILK